MMLQGFVVEWTFSFDGFNVVTDEELFPFVVIRVSEMAYVWMCW